ncbi:MAG: hypothetical protein ACTHKB_12970 [Burkholderiaceae bacterium]
MADAKANADGVPRRTVRAAAQCGGDARRERAGGSERVIGGVSSKACDECSCRQFTSC